VDNELAMMLAIPDIPISPRKAKASKAIATELKSIHTRLLKRLNEKQFVTKDEVLILLQGLVNQYSNMAVYKELQKLIQVEEISPAAKQMWKLYSKAVSIGNILTGDKKNKLNRLIDDLIERIDQVEETKREMYRKNKAELVRTISTDIENREYTLDEALRERLVVLTPKMISLLQKYGLSGDRRRVYNQYI
jgi:hypothetical protein